MQNRTNPEVELGTWIGRRQAFGLFASKCSAADAQCLKELRDSRRYKRVANNWDEFCPRYLGLSRANADRIIQRLEEFGADYFALAQIVHIPEDAYRAIAGAVCNYAIEFMGEKIPICAENGRRIAEVVKFLREDAEVAARCLNGLVTLPDARQRKLNNVRKRLDSAFTQLETICAEPGDRAALIEVIEYGRKKLAQLATSACPQETSK